MHENLNHANTIISMFSAFRMGLSKGTLEVLSWEMKLMGGPGGGVIVVVMVLVVMLVVVWWWWW